MDIPWKTTWRSSLSSATWCPGVTTSWRSVSGVGWTTNSFRCCQRELLPTEIMPFGYPAHIHHPVIGDPLSSDPTCLGKSFLVFPHFSSCPLRTQSHIPPEAKPAESDQVCEPAPMSVQELESEQISIPEPELSICGQRARTHLRPRIYTSHGPMPKATSITEPARSDQVCEPEPM